MSSTAGSVGVGEGDLGGYVPMLGKRFMSNTAGSVGVGEGDLGGYGLGRDLRHSLGSHVSAGSSALGLERRLYDIIEARVIGDIGALCDSGGGY